MNIKWNGTTWAVGDADLPDYMTRTLTSPGSYRRSFYGTGRRHTRFDKYGFPLSWSSVGSTVRDNVSDMARMDGTVTLEYATGTFNCHAVPGSYTEQESGYQTYTVGVTLEES